MIHPVRDVIKRCCMRAHAEQPATFGFCTEGIVTAATGGINQLESGYLGAYSAWPRCPSSRMTEPYENHDQRLASRWPVFQRDIA
jgi:hypothetical protein